MRCRLALFLLAVALIALPAIAQEKQQPTFDVASIRAATPLPDNRSHIVSDPRDSHFLTRNESLEGILQFAFDLPSSRILGGPDSLRRTPFDIDANSDAAADAVLHALPVDDAKQRKREMVQALLRDRFHLTAHRETRDLPVYALVVAKAGPHMKPSTADGRMFNRGRDHINGSGYTAALLAQDLAFPAGRVVLDKTGLNGRYDIDLRWSTDTDNNPDALPSFFTAIEQQLGLKLQPAHGPVDVLVIDHVDPPTAN